MAIVNTQHGGQHGRQHGRQYCARCGHRMFVDALDARGRYIEWGCMMCGSRRYVDASSGRVQLPDDSGLRRGMHYGQATTAGALRIRRWRERQRELARSA